MVRKCLMSAVISRSAPCNIAMYCTVVKGRYIESWLKDIELLGEIQIQHQSYVHKQLLFFFFFF